MEKVSVLMSTYNEPLAWIRQSVESILNQTYKNIEFIIIVDNPKNKELIALLNDYELKNGIIKLFVNEQNMGLVKSLNKGLAYCTGDYIARMDADDISLPRRFEVQLKYMKEKGYDLVGCNYEVFFNGNIIKTSNSVLSDAFCKKVLQYESCIAHPAWMVRKEVYNKLNGYRNIDACEDLDFLQRSVIEGFRLGNCQDVLLKYRDNPNSISHLRLGRQRAIARKLTAFYKNGKILSAEEYKEYLDSDEFQRNCLNEERILFWSEKRDNTSQRFMATMHLIINLNYLTRKWQRRKVKCWKRKEDEDK